MTPKTDNHIDTVLRSVMERRAERIPALSDDFAQQVMSKMNARKESVTQHRVSTPLHYGRGWGWVGIAAVLLIAFLLWPENHTETTTLPEVQPVVAEATPQPVPLPIVEEKKEEIVAEVKPAPQPEKKHRKAERTEPETAPKAVEKSTWLFERNAEPQQVSVQTEDVLIPADKQALADMYLAEVALQVVYEQRAQTEAVRSYAASLTGEKEPQPVIAF